MNLPQIYNTGDIALDKNICDFCGKSNAMVWNLFNGISNKYRSILKKRNKRYVCLHCAISFRTIVGNMLIKQKWSCKDIRSATVFLLYYDPKILLCM